MSYAKVGNEPPKVFQASTHVHRVPGGVSILNWKIPLLI